MAPFFNINCGFGVFHVLKKKTVLKLMRVFVWDVDP